MEYKLFDDRELIRRAIAGDNPAFAALVDRHYGVLYALAVSMLRAPDRAEDVLQDGFIQIFENLRQLNDPEKFRSWAYTIVKRKCLAVLKEIKAGPITISELTESDATILNQKTSPAEANKRLDQQKNDALIQQAILELPSKYREVAVLFFLEEKKHIEIAKILGITYYAAEKRLLRAKKKLQNKLKWLR